MLKFAAALLVPALALVAPVGGASNSEASGPADPAAATASFSVSGQPPRYSAITLSGPGGWVRPAN